MILMQTEYGGIGSFYSDFFSSSIEVEVQRGTENTYVDTCVELVSDMPEAIAAQVLRAAKRYCLWAIEKARKEQDVSCRPEDMPPITEESPLEDLLPYIDLRYMMIDKPEIPDVIAFMVNGACAWEKEKGIEFIIYDGRLMFLGDCSGYSPWDPREYRFDKYNFALSEKEGGLSV